MPGPVDIAVNKLIKSLSSWGLRYNSGKQTQIAQNFIYQREKIRQTGITGNDIKTILNNP